MDITVNSHKLLEFDKITELLAQFAKSFQSRELCLNLVPFSSANEVTVAQEFTREAKNILDLPAELPLEFVADIQHIKNDRASSVI